MTESERLARLEADLGALRAEVERLRAEVRVERGAARAEPLASAPAPPRPRPLPIPGLARDPLAREGFAREGLRARVTRQASAITDGIEVESLVGRYGTVGLAALTILLGVGTFLTWVATKYTLTPTARVGFGLVAAAGVGGLGWWLRRRPGAGAFGNVLLALALAIVHVDAWGAGPYLGLVTPAVALGVAAVASAALALLAWRSGEQALFVVGTGGALVAPFVTAAGPGRPLVLAVYGWLVLTMGALAVRRGRAADGSAPPWTIAARLLAVGCSLYVGAMLQDAVDALDLAPAVAGAFGVSSASLQRDLPALFAVACAVGAMALAGARHRREIALADLAAALVALLGVALDAAGPTPGLTVTALAATLVSYVALRDPVRPDADAASGRDRTPAELWTFVAQALPVVLPLGFLTAALAGLSDSVSTMGALHAAGWALLAGLAAWDATSRAGGTGATIPSIGASHLATLGLASAIVPVLLLDRRPTACVVALSAHAALFAVVYGRVRRGAVLLPVLGVLAVASAWSWVLLARRPDFGYTPFATRPSLAAAAMVAAWCLASWQVWRAHPASSPADATDHAPPRHRPERALLLAAGPVAALLWGREELAHAFTPDTATFLLIAYFAAAGVASIFVGRARRVAGARQAGLALAIYAAVKALLQASALASVGLKVGSFLVVGGFLLAVAYWYRAAGATAREATTAA